jgi:O-acetyl-ADP-ribose deacetylase (regulator of RNase III)
MPLKKIQIIDDDYCHFAAEAIVNSSNDLLVLGSNVSSRISEVAGPELAEALAQHNLDRNSPLSLGSAVHTSSFNAGVIGLTKYIIHAVTLGSKKSAPAEGRLLATPETVFLATYNSIALADRLHCRSIVFPLMASRPGYSVLDTNAQNLRWVMATSMVIAMRHSLRALTHVQTVFISTWNTDKVVQGEASTILLSLIRENAGTPRVAELAPLDSHRRTAL